MVEITYHIFNNSSYSVYYGVDSEENGIETQVSPAPVKVNDNQKLYIWTSENNRSQPQDCSLKFPTHVLKDGMTYEADNFELHVTQRAKKFELAVDPGVQDDITVLVSVKDQY
jgi:hypothetical protein